MSNNDDNSNVFIQTFTKLFRFYSRIIFGTNGQVPREMKNPPNSSNPIDQFLADTQTFVQDVAKNFDTKQLPDSKQITDALLSQANALAKYLEECNKKLNAEVSAFKPEVQKAIKQVQTKLDDTAKTMKDASKPENKAKAQEIKKKVDQGLKDATNQVQQLVKAIEPETEQMKTKVTAVAKSLLEQINKISKEMESQINKTIEEEQKARKK